MAITDPTPDPVTGIPVDASYATQYQVPLGSQPINLEELNAQGKQGNWLYPDNLPPVVARLQARDLTNPGNAQDLSTDGKRNLNVNINALNPAVNLGGGGSMPTPTVVSSGEMRTDIVNDDQYTRAANWQFMTTVYAMDIYLELTNTPSSSFNNHNFFGFTDDDGVNTLWYAFIVAVGSSPSGVGTGAPYAFQHFDFGGGLKMATYLGRPLANGIWIHMNNKQAPVYAAVTLYGD